MTAGFLASGAAATDERVEDAATPFDRRRHGMVVGSGAAGLPATVDYQLWFDGDGNFAKFSVDMGATGTSEGTFSDWGTKVDIQAPPASDVTSMPGM